MKICSMTASFGCLSHETLKAEPGVNLFVRCNEQGKSTWAAFLLAMFYGIDSSERSSRGHLAAKSRYLPWNGEPMEGTVDILWQGRQIVLQRTSLRGRPMGAFRAYDKQTGQDVPELTGENCGRVLLGVEREVFRRTAFLSGEELTVTQDQDLARRLSNLAVAGTARDSYPEAFERLKNWKNRCRYHKTGRIPETEARKKQLQDTVEDLKELRQQRMTLAQTAQEYVRQEQELAQEKQSHRREELAEAETRVDHLAKQLKLHQQQTAVLPSRERLLQLRAGLELGQETEVGAVQCPPALAGLTESQLAGRAQELLTQYDRLTAEKAPTAAMPVGLAVLGAVGAVASGIFGLWALLGACCGLVLLGAGWLLRQRRQRSRMEQQRCQAQTLLEHCGVKHREELLPAVLAYRDHLLALERSRRRQWQRTLLLEEIAAFAPEAETEEEVRRAVEQALERHNRCDEVRQQLEEARRQQSTLSEAAAPDGQMQQLHQAALEANAGAEALRLQEQALGGLEEAEAKLEQLELELIDLLQREAALELAQQALEQAQAQMAQGYGPRLTACAGRLMETLTGGRYDAVIMGKEFQLSLRETKTGLVRPLEAMSSGTKDQAWLALRLAMTELLLPEEAPLVLDDALLTFDEQRTEKALQLLRQTGRQVLLFSCRAL